MNWEDTQIRGRIIKAMLEFIFLIAAISVLFFLTKTSAPIAMIEIDGLSKTGIQDETAIKQSLYNKVKLNVSSVATISDSATIREGSLSKTEDANYEYTSFIVDIPSMKQSYVANYIAAKTDDSLITSEPINIECITEQEDIIYSGFDCK